MGFRLLLHIIFPGTIDRSKNTVVNRNQINMIPYIFHTRKENELCLEQLEYRMN